MPAAAFTTSPQKMRGGGGNILLVALILLMSLCPEAGLAETLTVTSNADTVRGAYAMVTQDPFTLCHSATGATKQAVMSTSTTPLTLREALIRADNNDEADTIRFDSTAFAPTASPTARTITLGTSNSFLPWMCEGNLTIDGDVDGDGTSDVIVQGDLTRSGLPSWWLFGILSDNNTITNLTIKYFHIAGVTISHFIGATSTPGSISSVTGNTITNTTFDNRTYRPSGGGIILQAGSGRVARGPGGIRNTTITGNTFLFNNDNVNSTGIELNARRSRSFIDGTTIGASLTDPPSVLATKRNTIRGGRLGILLETNAYEVGNNPHLNTDKAITNTTIRGNHLLIGSDAIVPIEEHVGGARIAGRSSFGSTHRITDLHILDNRIEDYRYNSGIHLAAGSCGARNSQMTATIARNTLLSNGGLIPPPPGPPHQNVAPYTTPGGQPFIVDTRRVPAIMLYGGQHGWHAHLPCQYSGVRSSSSNSLTVTLESNTVQNNYDTGIAVIGGSFLADTNTVTARLSRNQIRNNGRDGIALIGGLTRRQRWPHPSMWSSPPPGFPVTTDNTLTATLTDNLLTGQAAGAGLRLSAGDSGPANNNRVTVTGWGNVFGGVSANRWDIVGQGGVATSTPASLFPADIITNPRGTATSSLTALFPANSGTGNQLTGSLTPLSFDPDLVVVEDGTTGNTARLTVEQFRPASPPRPPPPVRTAAGRPTRRQPGGSDPGRPAGLRGDRPHRRLHPSHRGCGLLPPARASRRPAAPQNHRSPPHPRHALRGRDRGRPGHRPRPERAAGLSVQHLRPPRRLSAGRRRHYNSGRGLHPGSVPAHRLPRKPQARVPPERHRPGVGLGV